MIECFFTGCDNEATHKIVDAVENPRQFNGKMICKEHQEHRELLKAEPKDEPEKKEKKEAKKRKKGVTK